MEGDSHLEHERFMTEMGYVPPVKGMYYVAYGLLSSKIIHVFEHLMGYLR